MKYLLEKKKDIECSPVNILEIYPNETNIIKYKMWSEKYIILKTNNNSYRDLLNRQLENHSKRKMFTKMNE